MDVNVSVSEKFTLSIEEASHYFGIGEKRLRKIIQENEDAPFVLYIGSQTRLKRRLFETWIEKTSSI